MTITIQRIEPLIINMRKAKRIMARCGLMLAGLLIGLTLAELALRVMGISYPLPYLADPHVGSRLQPGFSAWFTQEGEALVRINRAGFRDREHAIAKPADTVRIAVLGDSFAEAVQVPVDQTFWSVLEDELQARGAFGGGRIEVLNFGISGHGTAQQLQMLHHHVWQYDPDIVLLAFFAGNDVRNNSQKLEPDPVRPFYKPVRDRLVLDDSFRQLPDFQKANSAWVKWKVRLINSSRLLQLLNHWKQQGRTHHPTSNEAFEPGLDDRVFAPPPDGDWREAWDLTDRLILKIHGEAEAHDARLVVALVTQAVQVHPDPHVRRAFAVGLDVEDLSYPERRLIELGQRHGFEVVPLADSLAEYAERHGAYLHGFPNTAPGAGHWNAIGHRLAGERIAEALDQRGPE